MPKTWAHEHRTGREFRHPSTCPPGKYKILRTEKRYRERRLRDVAEAAKIGVSQEFLDTAGARYIAGETEN